MHKPRLMCFIIFMSDKQCHYVTVIKVPPVFISSFFIDHDGEQTFVNDSTPTHTRDEKKVCRATGLRRNPS